jgi:hypothetical protein
MLNVKALSRCLRNGSVTEKEQFSGKRVYIKVEFRPLIEEKVHITTEACKALHPPLIADHILRSLKH